MKLSISTLGCPDWDFLRVVNEFENLQVEIEARGIDGEMDAARIARFSPERAEETKGILRAHHLKIVGFGASCRFHDPEEMEENVAAARAAIDVCARMGIPWIRVFGNDIPDASRLEETARTVCEGLKRACAYGAERGVGVNLEVHGDFNTRKAMENIVEGMAGVPGFGIIWDIEHSDKTCGDDFMPFYEVIRPLVRHVHVKDYIRGEGGKFTLCLMGEGDIPVKAIIRQLERDGYDGYFSFEWEKKWVPSLAEPEVAFPAFVQYMRAL
jgi:sugar phosphate isomerase/epimerase